MLDKQILQEVVRKKLCRLSSGVSWRPGAGALQGECAQVVPAGAAATIGLVCKERGKRSECAAPAQTGDRDGPSPIRLPARAGHAHA